MEDSEGRDVLREWLMLFERCERQSRRNSFLIRTLNTTEGRPVTHGPNTLR